MSEPHRRTGKAWAALATFPWKVLWGEVTGRHPHRAAQGVTPRLSTSTGHQWSRIPPQVEAKLSHPVAQGLAAAASLTTPAGHSHVRGKGGRKRGRPLSCSSSSNSTTHSLGTRIWTQESGGWRQKPGLHLLTRGLASLRPSTSTRASSSRTRPCHAPGSFLPGDLRASS